MSVLKDALLNNITKFLTELGTGFAYVGKEYRLQIGEKENFIDLLFYNLNLSCYIVLEVKIGSFTFADVGQLGGYVVACNHLLRKEGRDNPTIGILICKEKDRIQAQYALESSYSPAGSRLLCFTQNDHIGHAGFKICPFLKWAHFSCIILVSCADTRVVYREGVS